jgi:hypothetical protein
MSKDCLGQANSTSQGLVVLSLSIISILPPHIPGVVIRIRHEDPTLQDSEVMPNGMKKWLISVSALVDCLPRFRTKTSDTITPKDRISFTESNRCFPGKSTGQKGHN